MSKRAKGLAPQTHLVQALLTAETYGHVLKARGTYQGMSATIRQLIVEALEARGFTHTEEP